MRATYEDSGSGQLTGRDLQELAAQLPPEARITNIMYGESQTDGFSWRIKAVMPEVKVTHLPHHRPGQRSTGQRADHG